MAFLSVLKEMMKKKTILQLINHWETVITNGVFWIIIQGLSDKNKQENYNSSFL